MWNHLQMTSPQWGCTMPRPAEQSIPPIATPRLRFPSSQHPSYLVNSNPSHPEKLHSGFQYMAPSHDLQFPKPQLQYRAPSQELQFPKPQLQYRAPSQELQFPKPQLQYRAPSQELQFPKPQLQYRAASHELQFPKPQLQYMAPSQELKLQNPQLPPRHLNSHPVYSSMSQEELHRELYLHQQSLVQAHGMGYSSPAAPSSDVYRKMLQFRSDGSGYVSGMHFSASDRSSTSKLPNYYEAVGQYYKNYAQNVASPDQRVMESSQPAAYQMPRVDQLPSADYQRQALSSVLANLGHLQHLGNEVNVVGHRSSVRSECASGLPRNDSRLSQGVSSSCLSALLSSAERESCVHKESFCKSRNPSQKSKSRRCSQKNVDSSEHFAKEAEPDHGRREYGHQYLSSCFPVELPVISSSVKDKNNDCSSTSSLSSKEGAKNNVNRVCGIEKNIRHSDLPGKQQMNVNSRSDSTNSCNEPKKCVEIANNTGMRKALLGLLLAPPLNKTTADTTPTRQVNDNSVRQAASSPQDCHCARNPSACFLHNPHRSPADEPQGLTDQTASDGSVLPGPDAQSVTNSTSDNVAEQEIIWDMLEKDIDVMRLMYRNTSSSPQALDSEGSEPALYAKNLQVSDLEHQSPGEKHSGGQSKVVSSLCSGHPISDKTKECFQDAVSPSTELRSGSDTADLENEGKDIYDHTCMVCLKMFSSRDEVSKHLSVHLKSEEMGPELEDGSLVQNTMESDQGCSTQLTLETEGDTLHVVLLPAGQMTCEQKVKKNIKSKACTCDQSECCCDGQENKENSNSGASEDQKRVPASVAGQKHTVAATHKHETPVQLTSLSNSDINSAFDDRKLSEKDRKGEHNLGKMSESSADQNVFSSVVHKLQCTQNVTAGFCSADSESQPISDHVVPETLGNSSENGKSNSRSDHSHLKSTGSEQRTESSKSGSNSSKQSAAQDCCSSKVSLTEQGTKTSEKTSSNSSRQNVEKEHCDKVCVDSSRRVALSSKKRDASEKKFEHRANTKRDSSALHSQVKQIRYAQVGSSSAVSESGHSHQQKTKDGDIQQNKPTSLSTTQESFASDVKSITVKRKCESHDDGCKKRKPPDVTIAEPRKYHSSKGDGELTANGKDAGSDSLRMYLAPYPKEDSKSHSESKKQKSEITKKRTSPSGTKSHFHSQKDKTKTSEHVGHKSQKTKTSEHAGHKSQMHSGTNKHSVEQKGLSADNRPDMTETTPLLQTPDSSFSAEPMKHAASTSYQCSKQTGTRQCSEVHRDKNVKISAEKCSGSISNIEEVSKTENNAQDCFKPSEQHYRKSTREEVVHNDLTTQENGAYASETATLAERNIDANCPPNKKHKHQEVTHSNDPTKELDYADAAKSKKDVEVSKGDTLSQDFDQMTAKTDKAKKIVSSLRNIFQNNKHLLSIVHNKKVAEAKGQSQPPKKNMEGAENNPKHSFQDSRDLCKGSTECGQDSCTNAVDTEITSETVVASDQADGKMLKTEGSSRPTVEENMSDDKNSTQKIQLTLCIKCMTMFANIRVYEEHGCLNHKTKETDHADATNSEDDEVTKGHAHEVLKSDSFITCNKRTKHSMNKEENCASGSRLSDISDSESQQKQDSRGDLRGVKVVETVQKKRKRILTYDEKAKTKRQADSRDRRSNSKRSVQTMFSCNVCNQTYSSRGGLLFHWQAVHKK